VGAAETDRQIIQKVTILWRSGSTLSTRSGSNEDCSPLPHFLARDYARGIIKASLRADTDFQVNQELVDPPYESPEPEIPSAKELKQQWESVVEATEHDWESLDSEWFDLIGGDYEGDGFSDFARYIVGTMIDTLKTTT